jgi:hypothetical protein
LRSGSIAEDGGTRMDAITAAKLEMLISQLDAQIQLAEELEIPSTKLLLTMARLDLQATRHGIGHGELRTLCETVENALNGTNRARRPAVPAIARRLRSHSRLGARLRRARRRTASSLA